MLKTSRRTFLGKLCIGITASLTSIWHKHVFAADAPKGNYSSKQLGAPSTRFDMSGWKLQIPGPKEEKKLSNYSSEYFYLDSAGRMCFWVNCAESGHTANSHYVRSELRHLATWRANVSSLKILSAKFSVQSSAEPDKVTVMQIHGITDIGGNVPPLLRIAINEGALYAFIKTDDTGTNTEKIILQSDVYGKKIDCTIRVQNDRLTVALNGIDQFNRDISYWKYKNYFKAGCYPQSHRGIVTVMFRELSVRVD